MKATHLFVLLAVSLPLSALAESRDDAAPVERTIPILKLQSFDYGRVYVHTPERAELRRIAAQWRKEPTWGTITLEGHGFVAPDEEASIALGTKRAERVRDLLVKYGVDPRFIVAVGHSRATPGRYVEISVDTCSRCR